MKRIRPNPNALDWRDPKMPVLREYKFADGSVRNVVDPDYEHRYREFAMENSPNPGWRNDPTYERKRK